MNRRGFLRGALLTGAAFAISSVPGVVAAATPTVITITKEGVMLDAGFWSGLPTKHQQAVIQASDKALKIAQKQNMTVKQANGLLTKMVRPIVKQRTKAQTLLRDLLAYGLIAGLTWALADTTTVRQEADAILREGQPCGMNPASFAPPPSTTTLAQTGFTRNSAGNGITGWLTNTQRNWTGGTIPAPSGWSWHGQTTTNLGPGTSVTRAVYSRQVTSTNCANFQFPVPPISQLVDPADVIPPDTTIPQEALDRMPEISIKVPGAPISADATIPVQEPPAVTVSGPDVAVPFPGGPVTVGDFNSPMPAIPGLNDGVEEPHFAWPFDPAQPLPGAETPSPEPTPTPTSTSPVNPPYPTGSEVTPDAVDDLPTFDKFVQPFKTLFDPFAAAIGGAGTCGPVPVSFSFNTYASTGSFNICPAIEPIAGAIKVISAGVGAYTCIDNVLDA